MFAGLHKVKTSGTACCCTLLVQNVYIELKHTQTFEGGVLQVTVNLCNSKLMGWQFKSKHVVNTFQECKWRPITGKNT
jgi:hypothetical protein